MDIQRLKFAQARGARIECKSVIDVDRWYVSAKMLSFDGRPDRYRIHPVDEDMQYGAVSTAFRDMALYKDSLDEYPELVDLFMELAGSAWPVLPQGGFAGNAEFNMLCDWNRLFFAELLADEGL